jgi:CheY-like chemotaxis protein
MKDEINIMLVEDEFLTSAYLKGLLEKEGYRVRGVYPSGEEAIESVKSDDYNLIIMDINLSGELDGIETAGIIQSIKAIPVVYLSSVANLSVIQRADVSGHRGYLLKPVNPKDFFLTVSSAVGI